MRLIRDSEEGGFRLRSEPKGELEIDPARVAGSSGPVTPVLAPPPEAHQARDWLGNALDVSPSVFASVPARTVLKLAERVADLLQQAEEDDLTGCLRRGAGERALQREIARSHRRGSPLTVAFIDGDALKAVNDTAGHSEGDSLLRSVATAIRGRLRPYDLLIRWGGDEFVCVLIDCDVETARRVIAQAESAFRARTDRSFSAGYATLGPDAGASELVQRADGVLYYMKTRRRFGARAR